VGHDIPNYQLACKLIHQNLLFNSNGTKTKPVIDICYPLNISAHHMKIAKKLCQQAAEILSHEDWYIARFG
jgi:hypothetical protein